MQRIYIYVVLALVLIAFYYYKPLRNFISPEQTKGKSAVSEQQSSDLENAFDDLRIELYAIANKTANLQGKVQLLKMAQENRGWFNEEEFSQLPGMLAKTEEELKEAEAEYEKVKTKYARETVTQMIEESSDTRETEEVTDAPGVEALP
jgi:hypothetical protein